MSGHQDAMREAALKLMEEAAAKGDPLAVIGRELRKRMDEVPLGLVRWLAFASICAEADRRGERGTHAASTLEMMRAAFEVGREYQLGQAPAGPPPPPMTDEEFRALDRGDVVASRHSHRVVVVTGNYGGRVTAVDSADITNPREWALVRKAPPAP